MKGDRCSTPKCAIVRKPYAPGMHGGVKKYQKGLSEFGKQSAEKQKIKRIYGVSEKQFKRHLADATKQEGVAGDNLINRLEMRFDNIIFRLGWASSRAQARQLVSHSIFLVNEKILNVPSAKLKIGDEIKVKEQKLEKSFVKELQTILKKKQTAPVWLSLDPKTMSSKILAIPSKEEVSVGLDTHLVIEFYSR